MDGQQFREMGARIPRPSPAGISAVMFLGAAGLVAYAGYQSLYTVPGGHRAILFSRLSGLGSEVVPEGTHFRVPWLQRVIVYDIRTKPRNISSLTGSRDLQMVNISIRVLSRPEITALSKIYRKLGLDYDERVLPSIVNEVCKQVIAQFNASQLLTQRDQVARLIQRNLVSRAKEFNIALDDVSITDLRFGREFMAAVERKQVAQQDAERARFMVDKALQDKRSIIIKAQGEATSAELIGKAIANNPGFLELRKIDAARTVASTISRSANKVFLDANSLMLNLMGEHTTTDIKKGTS
jgi:prohibitin 2